MSKSSLHDLRDISDDDVQLLYEIVTAAERSSSPPIRALFTAYDQVLSKRGVSKEHDALYLRFLLRMGEERKEGQGVFEQFESLLTRLGMQIAFDREEENEETKDAADGRISEERYPSLSVQAWQTQPFRPSRRASFDSAYDSNADSQRSNSQLTFKATRSQSADAITTSPPRLSSHEVVDSLDFPDNDKHATSRGRLMSRDADAKSLNGTSARLSPSPVGRPRSTQLPRHSSASSGYFQIVEDESSDNASESGRGEDEAQKKADKYVTRVRSPHHDKRRAESHARTLRYHQTAARAIGFFRQWREKAAAAFQERERLLLVAQFQDTSALKRQALQQWQSALRLRHRQQETALFFANLEDRASEAHRLILLSKAFTHWAQCASEEVARKDLARRHILRTRYFTAWRDVAVANEFKVKRHRLNKFFSTWKIRTAGVIHAEDRAIDFAEFKAVTGAYRTWFWRFCETRAPAWRQAKLQQNAFVRWIKLTREAKIRETWAVDFRNLELQRRETAKWTERSLVVQSHNREALQFRWRNLLAPTVETLRRELQLAPVQAQFAKVINSRIARSVLDTWRRRLCQRHQASEYNRSRTLRNTWRAWNDQLRTKALERLINDRIVGQALCKWVLVERLALCERVRRETTTTRLLSLWRSRMNDLSESLGEARYVVESNIKNRSAVSILKKWSCMAQAREEEALRAERFHERTLSRRLFRGWTSKWQHTKQMASWADDAHFYVLTNRSIKRWHESTNDKKRNKRRDAYAFFRRKTKTKTAGQVFQRWKSSAHEKRSLLQHGEQVYQQRLLIMASNQFDRWHGRTLDHQNSIAYALARSDEHLLRTHLYQLRQRHAALEDLESRALRLRSENVEKTAASSLRKLKWRLFQVKALPSPESLAGLHQQKHYRNMLRYWAESARRKREASSAAQSFDSGYQDAETREASETPLSTLASRLKSRARLQGASAPNVPPKSAPGVPREAATPGYLRTPSRLVRVERPRTTGAAAKAEPQNTPASARITPFMNRLRAQYGGALSNLNPDAGGDLPARLGAGVGHGYGGFEDIREAGPLLTPRVNVSSTVGAGEGS